MLKWLKKKIKSNRKFGDILSDSDSLIPHGFIIPIPLVWNQRIEAGSQVPQPTCSWKWWIPKASGSGKLTRKGRPPPPVRGKWGDPGSA